MKSVDIVLLVGVNYGKMLIRIFKNVYIFQAKVNIVNDFMKLKY